METQSRRCGEGTARIKKKRAARDKSCTGQILAAAGERICTQAPAIDPIRNAAGSGRIVPQSALDLAIAEPLGNQKVAGSHFDIVSIVSVMQLVLYASTSMRAASRSQAVINHLCGWPLYEYPSHTTVRNFLLRTGLYLLRQNTQQRADDWIWIADHTYSVGTRKVFLILGIRLSDFATLQEPLKQTDVQVLAMLTVETSNSQVVCQQFRELAKHVGVPLAILSDAGSDLKKGASLFQEDHNDLICLCDIVHLISRKVEKVMNSDDRWEEFRQACCRCAHAVRQSPLAHLKPPRPRTKARYMNIDREVRWGARTLQILDRVRSGELTAHQQARLPRELVEEKFGWLDGFRASIKSWEQISLTSQSVIHAVRQSGYGRETVAAVEQLASSTGDEVCRALNADIVKVIRPMSEAASRYDRLPSSSEVIESLIGKGKRLLSGTGSGTTNSLTMQLLAMVASTARLTPTLVREALANCSIKDLRDWSQSEFGRSLHYLRRLDLRPTTEEQNLRKLKPTAIPAF